MQVQSLTEMVPGRIYRFKTPNNNRLFMYTGLDEDEKDPRFVQEKAICVDLFEKVKVGARFGHNWMFSELDSKYTLHTATDEEIAIWNSIYPSLEVQQSVTTTSNNHYQIY